MRQQGCWTFFPWKSNNWQNICLQHHLIHQFKSILSLSKLFYSLLILKKHYIVIFLVVVVHVRHKNSQNKYSYLLEEQTIRVLNEIIVFCNLRLMESFKKKFYLYLMFCTISLHIVDTWSLKRLLKCLCRRKNQIILFSLSELQNKIIKSEQIYSKHRLVLISSHQWDLIIKSDDIKLISQKLMFFSPKINHKSNSKLALIIFLVSILVVLKYVIITTS